MVAQDICQEDVKRVALDGRAYKFWFPKWIDEGVIRGGMSSSETPDFELVLESLAWLPESGAVVDIGAGVGDRSVFWASRGYFGHVIDCDAKMLQVAAVNFQINDLAGRGDFHGLLMPQKDPNPLVASEMDSYTDPRDIGQIEAEFQYVENLDSLELGIVSLIRLNMPGREAEVLAGAENTIGRLRPIVIVENVGRGRFPALSDRMCESKYFLWKSSTTSCSFLFVPLERLTPAQLSAHSARTAAAIGSFESGSLGGSPARISQIPEVENAPSKHNPGPRLAVSDRPDVSGSRETEPVSEVLNSYRELNALYSQFADFARVLLENARREVTAMAEWSYGHTAKTTDASPQRPNAERDGDSAKMVSLEQVAEAFRVQIFASKEAVDHAENAKSAAETSLETERERMRQLEDQLEKAYRERDAAFEQTKLFEKRESDLERRIEELGRNIDNLKVENDQLQSSGVAHTDSNSQASDSLNDGVRLERSEDQAVAQLRTMVISLRALAHSRSEGLRTLQAEVDGCRMDLERISVQNASLRKQRDEQVARLNELARKHRDTVDRAEMTEAALKDETADLRRTERRLREELHRVRTSKTFRAGSILRDSVKSVGGFLSAPRELWALRKLQAISTEDSGKASAGSDGSQSAPPAGKSSNEEQR